MSKKLSVVSRCIAASIGGYAISILFSLAVVPLFALILFLTINEAVMLASMLSYLVFFFIIIASFSKKSARLLWRDLLVAAAILGGIYFTLGH